MVSDIFSRKLSLILGTFTKGLSIFLMVFSPHYVITLFLSILMALGESLVSGSDTSIIYDTLLSIKKATQYKKILSSAFIIIQIYMGLCVLIGGFLGEFNLSLPLILSFPFYLAASFTATRFIEPNNLISVRKNKKPKLKGQFKSAIRALYLKNDQISWDILLQTIAHFFIMGFISSSIFWIITPIFDNFAVSVGLIGTLTLIFRLAKSFGSWLFSKYDDPDDLRSMKLSTLGLLLLLLGMILFQNLFVTIVLYALIFIVQVFYQYNYNQYTNKLFKSQYRATLNSLQSMIVRFWAFLILPLFGFLIEKYSYAHAIGVLFSSVAIGLILLCIAPYFKTKDI